MLSLVDREWNMLIGGELVCSGSGKRMPVIHPGTETVVAEVPCGVAADVDAAVAAALAAAGGWRETPISERAAALSSLADEIERHGEELAWIDVIDNGSPISAMIGDYGLAAKQIRYFAGLALQLRGETIPVRDANALDFTLRVPFGVVGRIVPFNHPLMFAASRIAAPLLAGNSVVLKPAETTPLSALRMAELAAEIFPPGVLNVVTGDASAVGDRLVVHPGVRRIAFTGSEAVGRQIQARAASSAVKTITLELGGKNPIIVFPDADLEDAVDGVVRGMNFGWQGQSCGSTSRLFVHASIFDKFVDRLAVSLDSLLVGDPLEWNTEVGPLASRGQYVKTIEYVENGLRDPDLELRAGGERYGEVGYFVRPTLFVTKGPISSRLFAEEIFGPVLVAAPFETLPEAIGYANALPLGLTAGVWTKELGTAMAAIREIDTGYLWLNWSSSHIPGAPFGGVKNSGVGREEGLEELQSFTQLKNVYLRS